LTREVFFLSKKIYLSLEQLFISNEIPNAS
jgi:hypothetical protein